MNKDNPMNRQVGGDHYKNLAIQPTEFSYKNKLNYLEGSAIKYIVRHRLKDKKKDLQKAIHFIEILMELEYPEIDPMTVQYAESDEQGIEIPEEIERRFLKKPNGFYQRQLGYGISIHYCSDVYNNAFPTCSVSDCSGTPFRYLSILDEEGNTVLLAAVCQAHLEVTFKDVNHSGLSFSYFPFT